MSSDGEEPFDESRFLEDMENGSKGMNAPYSMSVIKNIMQAYGDLFGQAAIQIFGSSKPGTPIGFRLLTATPADTIAIGERNGWHQPDNPLVQFHVGLHAAFPRTVNEPQFTLDRGCEGMFQYLGEPHHLDAVLAVPAVPESFRAHRQRFLDNQLQTVEIVETHYEAQTVGIYFLVKGPVTKQTLTDIVALAGAAEPSDGLYEDVVGVLLDSPYYLTVVLDFNTGAIVEVQFHVFFPVKLPPDMRIPDVGDRLDSFWDVPSHDSEDIDILRYCFTAGEEPFVMAFRSHCGGLRRMMKIWNISGA